MVDDGVIDCISQEPFKVNLDDNTSQSALVCLSTSLVLKKILESFSNTELLKLSFVNKQWNYEARSVLRDRGNVMAIKGPKKSCADFVAFVSDLEKMNVVPFSGISIVPHGWVRRCGPSSTKALDPTQLVNLDRLQWKHLSVTLDHEDLEKLTSCPAFLAVKKVLEDFCGLLEELAFNLDREGVLCLRQVLEDCSFPRLKTLKFGDLFDTYLDEDQIDFIKMLVPLAPNLRELHLRRWTDFKDFLDGTSAVLVTDSDFGLDDMNSLANLLHNNDFSESLAGVVKLKSMNLQFSDLDDFEVDGSLNVFNTIIPVLLQSSHSTLRSLLIDAVCALPLMIFGICLENVRDFEIVMDFRELKHAHPRILTVLKSFDFTRILPNLTKVQVENSDSELSLSPEQIAELADQWNRDFSVAMPDRAVNIKHLCLHDILEHCNVPFFAGMFPNIEELTLFEFPINLLEIPYSLIWEYWKNLKVLEVQNSDIGSILEDEDEDSVFQKRGWRSPLSNSGPSQRARTVNLDSVFCGIFPEELAELKKKDDEYLKTVNIVPVMPSITCMRALKMFKLSLPKVRLPGRANNSTFMFSKVSGLVAFARCPALSVILETDSPDVERALSHMKPYASVVLDYELGYAIGIQ